MYYAFSGYFKPKDCSRALKFNESDIEAAAAWLVNEKEQQQGGGLEIQRLGDGVLLCESEISKDPLQPERADVLKTGSLLNPTECVPGRWTLNKGRLTYHGYNNYRDGFALMFDITGDSIREIPSEETADIRGTTLEDT